MEKREHSVKKQYSDVYCSDACYTTQKEDDFEERQSDCSARRKVLAGSQQAVVP